MLETIYLTAILIGPGDIEFETRVMDTFDSKQTCMEYVEKRGWPMVRGIHNQYQVEQESTGDWSLPLEKVGLVCTPIDSRNM